MRPALRALAVLSTTLVLGACGGGSPTTAPTVGGPAPTTVAVVTEAPKVCTEPVDAATTVEASVGGNEWGAVTAKVDDVITWTNSDGVPHKVGLDDGSCTMSQNIAGGGGKQSLVFTVAGTYPFHCTVHSSMKGTITIN